MWSLIAMAGDDGQAEWILSVFQFAAFDAIDAHSFERRAQTITWCLLSGVPRVPTSETEPQ